ncbi:MAG: hypothetical protein ACD_43C00026G0004 [uncultured bacterium]|nr:MAG: hypothetical protein ACD_43C00026G0004 [uncultured bacterium]
MGVVHQYFQPLIIILQMCMAHTLQMQPGVIQQNQEMKLSAQIQVKSFLMTIT